MTPIPAKRAATAARPMTWTNGEPFSQVQARSVGRSSMGRTLLSVRDAGGDGSARTLATPLASAASLRPKVQECFARCLSTAITNFNRR